MYACCAPIVILKPKHLVKGTVKIADGKSDEFQEQKTTLQTKDPTQIATDIKNCLVRLPKKKARKKKMGKVASSITSAVAPASGQDPDQDFGAMLSNDLEIMKQIREKEEKEKQEITTPTPGPSPTSHL